MSITSSTLRISKSEYTLLPVSQFIYLLQQVKVFKVYELKLFNSNRKKLRQYVLQYEIYICINSLFFGF